jgi:DNA polymerase
MMIGRNPGINEDKLGKPFVGRGGEVLEAWLRGLGLKREQVWLTNTMKCYTQADRKPKGREVNTCWNAHLRWEIAYCRPELIIPLGAEAFQVTTGLQQLTYRHGILYDKREAMKAYVMGVIHPGSALRSAEYKSMMVEDAQNLKPLLPIALAGRLLEDGPPEGLIAQ